MFSAPLLLRRHDANLIAMQLRALYDAVKEVERNRYRDILDQFRKNIGKNIVDFTAGNIEAKMVELGLDEGLYIEKWDQSVRRRKKVTAEQRRRGSNGKDDDANDESHSRRPSCAESIVSPPFMPEQMDEVLDQIGQHRAVDAMHVDPAEPKGAATSEPDESAAAQDKPNQRMARELCDDMFSVEPSPFSSPSPVFARLADLAAAT